MTKQPTQHLRDAVDHSLNAIQMLSFNDGFESAANALEELANLKHNQGDNQSAEVLQWASLELRGDNA
jgi:hypothetical protein